MDRASIASLRDHLCDRAKLGDVLDYFIRMTVLESASDSPEEDRGPFSELCDHLFRTTYGRGADIIHQYSESEIEKIFLSSLLLCFLKADPFNFVVSTPSADTSRDTERYRALLSRLDEIAGPSAGRTSRDIADGLLVALREMGKETGAPPEEAERLHAEYIVMKVLGFSEAFFLVPQAGFPNIQVGNRRVRLDAYVWRPLDPAFGVAVECDGYEFHHGREQFTQDRQRDRVLRQHGLEVLRFSGSEIFNDPAGAAIDLFDFLQKKVGGPKDG